MNDPVHNEYCCRTCPQTAGRKHGPECQRMYETIFRWLPILEEDDPSERRNMIDAWQAELKAADDVEEEAELEGLSEEGVDVIKKMRQLAEPFVRLVKREQTKVNNIWSSKVAKERKRLKKWQ